MKPELTELICCPVCNGRLQVTQLEHRVMHYYGRRFVAWRHGRYARAKQFLVQYPDDLGMHILVWSVGELFLIAKKP
jgi:uncharacterized protein YbaR (Trm112 family)